MSITCDKGIYPLGMDGQQPFGEWVEDRYLALGLTQRELADAVGVGQSTVSGWVSAGKLPRARARRELAKALRVSLEELERHLPADESTHGVMTVHSPTGVRAEMRVSKESLWQRLEQEIRLETGVSIPLIGVVPADAVRWTLVEQDDQTVSIPAEWANSVAGPLVAVLVSGDCLLSHGVVDGDHVVLERITDRREVHDADVVLVRIGDEYTLKRWFVRDGVIILKDGNDTEVRTITDTDDLEVIGVARFRFGAMGF